MVFGCLYFTNPLCIHLGLDTEKHKIKTNNVVRLKLVGDTLKTSKISEKYGTQFNVKQKIAEVNLEDLELTTTANFVRSSAGTNRQRLGVVSTDKARPVLQKQSKKKC